MSGKAVRATVTLAVTVVRHTNVDEQGKVWTFEAAPTAEWVQATLQRAYDHYVPALYEVTCTPTSEVGYT